jgi:signal transduction histidine kinase
VIEALPEAVFVMDGDGRLRLTNPAADDLFAAQPIHDRDDLLSRFEVIDPAPTADAGPDLSAAQQAPLTLRPRDQPHRWNALRTNPLDADGASEPAARSGSATSGSSATEASDAATEGRTVFVLRDVTYSRHLEPEGAAFLSVLSHELRTPITTIYAGSSVLARRPSLPPPASQILAQDISAEAARLYDLVEDLLVLARLERQVLELSDEPVHLNRAVEATIRVARERAPDVRVERSGLALPPAVRGDRTYVEQACRNLLFAALRFGDGDGPRELLLVLDADPRSREVSLAVRDGGPGLTPEDAERIFELPEGGASGRLAGLGIGPFVCRHLVEAMGGRVWARNRPDGGLETGFALRVDERG